MKFMYYECVELRKALKYLKYSENKKVKAHLGFKRNKKQRNVFLFGRRAEDPNEIQSKIGSGDNSIGERVSRSEKSFVLHRVRREYIIRVE